jgi:phenylacetate-coenzyme A ligase PaaK-like adenylate-forming protein
VFPAPFDQWNVWPHAAGIWWTRQAGGDAVAAAGARRTSALIEFAGSHSPFYRDRWKGISLDRVSLRDLPVVTKHELMSRFDDWLTDRSVDYDTVARFLRDRSHIGEPLAGKYLVWKSSGSTGEPGVYLQDGEALAVYDALLAMQLHSINVATHYVWGMLAQGGRAALVAATGDHFASIASWQRVCRGAPWPNARAFSVAEPLLALVAQLNAFQPAFLASYPTTLVMLADEQRAGRLAISPACMWSGGEYLSHAAHVAIERAFGTVLVNEFGASECLSIAQSCRQGILHVNADWVVLEPVDRNFEPTPPGEASHTVLLTNLANRIQPIVRYDLGDSVTMSATPCACGSPLPAIEVEGRRDDVLCLHTSDGTTVRVSPLALTTVMEEVTGSHRFQLVQTGPAEIEVRLDVHEPRTRSAEWHAVQRALCTFMAQQSLSNVRVHLAAKTPAPDPCSGKLREVLAYPKALARRSNEGRSHVRGP